MQGWKAITGRRMARQRPHGWRERVGGMRREPAAAGVAGVEERRWLCPAGAGEVSCGSPGTLSPGRGVCNALSVCTSTVSESRHLLVFWNPCPTSPKSCFSSQLPGSPTVFQFL